VLSGNPQRLRGDILEEKQIVLNTIIIVSILIITLPIVRRRGENVIKGVIS
jgi:hypothetical protein